MWKWLFYVAWYVIGFATGFVVAAFAVWKGNEKAIANRMIKLNGKIFFLEEVR